MTHVVLFGIFSIIMVALQLVSQPFFAAGIINGVGHHFGYRSYEMASTATNIIPWGLFIAGEELHNNHHAFPWSARFSLQKWEFDMGWLFITVFKSVGPVQGEARCASPALRQEGRGGYGHDPGAVHESHARAA